MLTRADWVVSGNGVTVENRTDFEVDLPRTAKLVDFLKSELGIDADTSVEVTLVDEDEMTGLHVRYMGLLGPTDVLSFPAIEVANGPVDPAGLRNEPTLGDIVICPEFITGNTQSDPTQADIDACVIHAMLHLIGHDHGDLAERTFMKDRERHLESSWRTVATTGTLQSARA